jgi:hypothetical protein
MRHGAPDCAVGKYARPALEATGGGTAWSHIPGPGYTPSPPLKPLMPAAPLCVYERAREWFSMGLVRGRAA